MTPQEADILRFMSRMGQPVSNRQIAGQFGMSTDPAINSLKRHLLVEQDGQFFRPTKGAEEALKDYGAHFGYVPFEGRPEW